MFRWRGATAVVVLGFLTVALMLYYMNGEHETSQHFHVLSKTGQFRDRYLVRSSKCHIQNADPYDEEVRAFIRSVEHVSCSRLPPLTELVAHYDYGELRVRKEAIHEYSRNGVTCCYSTVTRPERDLKPDDALHVSECLSFNVGPINTSYEFVIVRCATRHRKKEIYREAHASVHVRSEVRRRLDKAQKIRQAAGISKPLSVLVVGVDSVSRLNALRTLPRTLTTLRRQGWTELLGYNKIADNTYPNLMAILTGIEGERSYEECRPTQLGRLDACPFLWHRFRDEGYVTAYAEDEPDISTFNFLKVGFVRPPTDHYLRPFLLAAQRELHTTERHSLKYCLGGVSAGERVLDFAERFTAAYANDTSFGLFWTNSFSHNDVNSPSAMDDVLARFFTRLHESGVYDSTFVLFISDHGMRFGDVRQTRLGWLEERLPLAWLSVPPWFRYRHASAWRALQLNSARLTTPYDLHATLRHVLALGVGGQTEERAAIGTRACSGCHSLFRPVDPERSCEDAAISPHWCTCTEFRDANPADDTVLAAARYVVSRVTRYVREGELAATVGAASKCAVLALARVLMARRGIAWDGRRVYFLLLVETLPGRGRYEATVSTPHNATERFQLHSTVSRLDQYAGQSRCISNAFLRKYCYCR